MKYFALLWIATFVILALLAEGGYRASFELLAFAGVIAWVFIKTKSRRGTLLK